MIIFIDLEERVCEGIRVFSWFNTITDTFFEFDGNQTWENWDDFAQSYFAEKIHSELYPLSRFKSLFPRDWGKG